MTIKYRKAYLTDGTQVKITEELFNQLREWEKEERPIHFSYIDMLKEEDNEMINKQRCYNTFNVSLEGALEKEVLNPMLLKDTKDISGKATRSIEMRNAINSVLSLCSEAQRRRFIKYYYLDFTLEKIAAQEGCSFQTVQRSIKKVEKRLIILKNLF